MKTKLSLVSAALLGATLTLAPVVSQAALPQAVDGQTMPSLAPMLEQTTPAVVSVAVSGTQVSRQRYRIYSATSLAPTPRRSKFRSDRFAVWDPVSS